MIHFFRITISEDGCHKVLAHEQSTRVLAKLIHSLGNDSAGDYNTELYRMKGGVKHVCKLGLLLTCFVKLFVALNGK